MTETAIKILREFGFPILVALGLGYALWWQMQRNQESIERWQTMMEYVMELRVDCGKR